MTKGWRLESARHSLAAKKIKTGKKAKQFFSKLGRAGKFIISPITVPFKIGKEMGFVLATHHYPPALSEQISDYKESEKIISMIEDNIDFAKHKKNIKKIVELQEELKKEEKRKNESEQRIQFLAKKYGYTVKDLR
jgi:hypothetical protein